MRLEIMSGTAAGLVELGEGASATRGVGTAPAGNNQPQSSQKGCFPLRGAWQLGHSWGRASASISGTPGASATGGGDAVRISVTGGGGATVATGIASRGAGSAVFTGIARGGETG